MLVRFQRANHRTGNESLLLKFEGVVEGQTACILVDSGDSVDVDSLLGPDEYLACVLVTHAHEDHVRTLAENVRDGAPVIAAAPTAAAVRTLLETGEVAASDDESTRKAVDALEGVTGWRTVLGNDTVRVHPVPAGHAPGAAGFVVQFRDGDVARNVLVTGDFTTSAAAGYPGFPTSLPVDVAAIIVNVATSDAVASTNTDALETALSRATMGFRTLVTASPLTGVYFARLAVAARKRWGLDVTVRLTGTTAMLYEALELPTAGLGLHHDFEDASAVLGHYDVTFASPASPTDGTAARLFEEIEHEADGALVQVTPTGTDAVPNAACSTSSFEVQQRPEEALIDELVDEYDPLHVVVGHETGAALDAYKDKYAAFVWANQDRNEQTLFSDGEWRAPPWVSERAERYVYGNTDERGGNALSGPEARLDVTFPTVEPHDVTLQEERLDVSRLNDRFATATASQSGDETVDDARASLDAVVDRLDRIEASLGIRNAERVPVTVVHDGDDTLLRVEDVDAEVDDAEDVTVLLDRDDE